MPVRNSRTVIALHHSAKNTHTAYASQRDSGKLKSDSKSISPEKIAYFLSTIHPSSCIYYILRYVCVGAREEREGEREREKGRSRREVGDLEN